MKLRFLLILIASLTMANCYTYGQVIVTEDIYKNNTIVTVELNHLSTGALAQRHYATITYIKEMQKGKPVALRMLIKVFGPRITGGANLDNGAFLNINGNKIPVRLNKQDSSTITGSSTSTETDNAGNNSVYKANGGQVNDSSTTTTIYTVHYALAQINLNTKNLIQLGNVENFEIRFYVNSIPITFSVAEKEMVILREFAATTKAK